MKIPKSRPERHVPPPGFVDAIGLDDDLIPITPIFISPEPQKTPAGFVDALGADHESIELEPIVIKPKPRG